MKDKKYCKVRDHCNYTGKYRSVAGSICNLKYSVPKKSPIAFHNGSNYDYHFIIKEFAEEFEKNTCLGEDTEIYITFTVLIKKEFTRIEWRKITKNISYILLFINSARFMTSSLSDLVKIFSEGIHETKRKQGHEDKK